MQVYIPKKLKSVVEPEDIPGILYTAANETRVRINNLRRDGRSWRFTLALNADYRYYRGGKIVEHAPYTRLNWRLTRIVSAVCWHGHRDFFLICYHLCPDLVFRTGVATYRGKEGFIKDYPGTGSKNIGSRMEPCLYEDACFCNCSPEDAPTAPTYIPNPWLEELQAQ